MLLGKEIKYAAHCVRYANFRFPLRIACEGMEEIAWKIFYKKYFRKINDIDTLIEQIFKTTNFFKIVREIVPNTHAAPLISLSSSIRELILTSFPADRGKKKKKKHIYYFRSCDYNNVASLLSTITWWRIVA